MTTSGQGLTSPLLIIFPIFFPRMAKTLPHHQDIHNPPLDATKKIPKDPLQNSSPKLDKNTTINYNLQHSCEQVFFVPQFEF